MPNPSFFFAIFKKLQVCDTSITNITKIPGGAGHFSSNRTDGQHGGLSGGFALFHPSDDNGMLGKLLASEAPTGLANLPPIVPTNYTEGENPLYVMLNTCVTATSEQDGVPVPPANLTWPPMPNSCRVTQAQGAFNPAWNEFGPAAAAALGTWIHVDQQLNDEPQGPLFFKTLNPGIYGPQGLQPGSGPQFPNLPANSPLLFVSSMAGDNGVRPGNVPQQFWTTSQIYLLQTNGALLTKPAEFAAGHQFYLAAAIGNSGTGCAGRLPPPVNVAPLAILLTGWAMAFATLHAPATQLPPLSNLDPTSAIMVYEQYFMPNQLYDVVGFRFDVSAVLAALEHALAASGVHLGGLTAAQWLQNGHPSLRVLIKQGGQFPAVGGITAPTITSSPLENCGIAWKNLGYAQIETGLAITWTHVIVSQAPADPEGVNLLRIEHDLPPPAFRVLLAMPTGPFERYVRKAGGLDGFEVVRDVASKPFPDAVILRETRPGSLLEIAGHAREPFLAMSLGVEHDATRLAPGRIGSVSVIHLTHEHAVVGGCTIEVEMAGARA